MAVWKVEPAVDIQVLISTLGPLDGLTSPATVYDVTQHVRGKTDVTIRRGRSTEFEEFQSGTCSFVLNNDGRRFDPTRAVVVVDLPGASGATATTPDVAALAPNGDIYVRARLSADDWTPGGFGKHIVGQWPNSAGNNGWVFAINPGGELLFQFTTDGSTDRPRSSTVVPNFADGSIHWVDVLLDVDNGASGHDVIFRQSEDGITWTQIGATVTNSGAVAVFNSTAALAVGDILNYAGQVYEIEIRFGGGVNGGAVATPKFTDQAPGTTSFTDSAGRVWTINGTASIRYDDDASPFAAILKPNRRVQVVAGYGGGSHTIYVGYLEGWPQEQERGDVRPSVPIVAHDFLSVLARTHVSDVAFVLDVSLLDIDSLSGDLPEQYTGQRVAAVIDLAGIVEFTSFDKGKTLMPADTSAADLLSVIRQAEMAEAGFFYVSRAGVLTFLDRHSRFEDTKLTVTQVTFTDAEYGGLGVEHDLRQVWNDARFSCPGCLPEIARDEDSITKFGHLTFPDSGDAEQLQVISPGEALGRAQFWVDRYSKPRPIPRPVTIKPRRNMAALFPKVIQRDLLDRVVLKRTPQGIPPEITFTGLVQSIEHRFNNEDWTTVIGISPVDLSHDDGFLALDDDNLGQLDQERLAY